MEELWLRFENKLRAFTMSKVNDVSVTDDILQELFIKIHENIDKVRDETKLQSWIYQICRNLIIDHFRNREKLMKGTTSFTGEEDEESDEMMTEALEDMVRMMDNLPPGY